MRFVSITTLTVGQTSVFVTAAMYSRLVISFCLQRNTPALDLITVFVRRNSMVGTQGPESKMMFVL